MTRRWAARIIRASGSTRGESGMASIESKSMDSPDETQTPTKATASVVHLGAATVKRLQAEPGFRWSES